MAGLPGLTFGFVNAASGGLTSVIPAAPAGFKYRVYSMFLMSSSAVTVNFTSGGTAITASYGISANGGMVLPMSSYGWFEGTNGQDVSINLSTGANVGVTYSYIMMPTP